MRHLLPFKYKDPRRALKRNIFSHTSRGMRVETRTIKSIIVTMFLVGMVSAMVVEATSAVETVEWLPPLTTHEEFAFTDGSTLPINFRLLDAAGSFVMDPTIEVTANKILFSDIFDDGNYDGWSPLSLPPPGDTSWSVTSTGVLCNDGSLYYPRILADPTTLFTDYIFEADARLLSGKGYALLFRAEDHDRFYSFQYDPGLDPGKWLLRLYRFVDFTVWPPVGYDVADPVECPVPTGYEQWHHLKVKVVGTQIECYIDGIEVFDVTDTDPSAPETGGIGLRTWAPGVAEFDNIVVLKVPEWESFSYSGGSIYVSESLYQCNLHTRDLEMPAGDYMITVWLEDGSVQVGSHPFELVEPGKGRGKP